MMSHEIGTEQETTDPSVKRYACDQQLSSASTEISLTIVTTLYVHTGILTSIEPSQNNQW